MEATLGQEQVEFIMTMNSPFQDCLQHSFSDNTNTILFYAFLSFFGFLASNRPGQAVESMPKSEPEP
jgi:hypothetical protein